MRICSTFLQTRTSAHAFALRAVKLRDLAAQVIRQQLIRINTKLTVATKPHQKLVCKVAKRLGPVAQRDVFYSEC